MGIFNKFRKALQLKELSAESRKQNDDTAWSHVELHKPMAVGSRALDVMTDRLYRHCLPLGWFVEPGTSPEEWTEETSEVIMGVCIRSKSGCVRSYPDQHRGFQPFEEAILRLNCRVAIKMHCKAVEVAMETRIDPNPELYELYINADTRIQVLETINSLGTARKSQYCAFIREEGVLAVWADQVEQVIPNAQRIEEALIAYLWQDEKEIIGEDGKSEYDPFDSSFFNLPTQISSARQLNSTSEGNPQIQRPGGTGSSQAVGDTSSVEIEDPELAAVKAARKERPVAFISAFLTGCSGGLTMVLMGFGLRSLVVRYTYDQDASRFALAAVLPLIALITAYPCTVLVSSLLYMFGPISQFRRNSVYYSALPPPRNIEVPLLPITIQMPVYKESLEDVIIPTIESLKVAVTTFERQGGMVNVIVCDDGLQAIPCAESTRRIQYYKDNNLAYVGRPAHGVDGYERRGRFKKAGNLNHCNMLSLDIETGMDEQRAEAMSIAGKCSNTWSEKDEARLYDEIMLRVLENRDRKTWAEGNIRIGEIILLIDSDTRVPQDCLLDGSLEMSGSPQVAIIQHASGVMQVANHFFENGMAFFTNMIQLAISMTVANGDTAPFVGHNAFLRWAALQDCAEVDPYDGQARVWSETHVSEDFQVSLKLQCKGWLLRWATYSREGFQEGVSLTCGDELSRWQKYAFGCSEIFFNPFRYWFTRGPLTKLFRQFLWSPIPVQVKWSILAYMASYYAFAIACPIVLLNFALVGLLEKRDTFYVTSWSVFFICVLLFSGLGNVAVCILRYRLKMDYAGRSTWHQLKWIPFFAIFFSGLSFAVNVALVCHMLSINISWTATAKSVQVSNFFKQFPAILKRFWLQISLSFIILGGMIVSTTSIVPPSYRVSSIEAIVPVAITFGGHLIWPFVLDPFFTTLVHYALKTKAKTTIPFWLIRNALIVSRFDTLSSIPIAKDLYELFWTLSSA